MCADLKYTSQVGAAQMLWCLLRHTRHRCGTPLFCSLSHPTPTIIVQVWGLVTACEVLVVVLHLLRTSTAAARRHRREWHTAIRWAAREPPRTARWCVQDSAGRAQDRS